MTGVVIFVTCESYKEGEKIAEVLLNKKLSACVNIIDNISSLFIWKERIEKEREVLLLIKTKKDLVDNVISAVKEVHSYEVPEIIALPILSGSSEYLSWIKEVVR
jgi:periplasmic divalent cation tolerance protein